MKPMAKVLRVPLAPTNLTAKATMSVINLAWSASATATKYTVYRSTASGTRGASLGDVTATSYIDTTAAPGTAYFYGVTASNATGESSLSSQVQATIPAVPAAPTGLSATIA